MSDRRGEVIIKCREIQIQKCCYYQLYRRYFSFLLTMDRQYHDKQHLSHESSNQHISYSRLAAEIDEEDKEKAHSHNLLQNPNIVNLFLNFQQNKNTTGSQQIQPKESVIQSEGGPTIKIHYSCNTQKQKIPPAKDNYFFKVEQLNSDDKHCPSKFSTKGCYSSETFANRSHTYRLLDNGLNAIQQHELQNKKSDEEAVESQASMIESKIVRAIKIQSISANTNSERGHQQKEHHKTPEMFTTAKKSKIGVNSLRNQNNHVYIRPINDSIELNEAGEEVQNKNQKNKLSICPILNQVVRPLKNQEGKGMLSSYSTVTKNKLIANPSKDQPTKKNQIENTRSQLELLQKIDNLQKIVLELKEKKYNKIEKAQSNRDKLKTSDEKVKINAQIEFLHQKLKSLKKKKIVININHSKKDPMQHMRSTSLNSRQLKSHRFDRADTLNGNGQVSKSQRKLSQQRQLGKQLSFKQLKTLCNNKSLCTIGEIAESKNKSFTSSIEQILAVFSIHSNYTIKVLKDIIIVRINRSNLILLIINSKKIYYGEYLIKENDNIVKEGKGIQIQTGISTYHGEFVHGKRHGKGRFWLENRYQYEGNWNCDQIQGHGILRSKEGNVYEGEFDHDEKNGIGSENFANGDSYEGQHLNGFFDGLGVYKWKNRSFYEGEFKKGLMHGKGKWYSQNGDTYEGSYRQNLKDGWGMYRWKSGKIFEGYFDRGTRQKQVPLNTKRQKRIEQINIRERLNKSISPSKQCYRIYFDGNN